MSGHSKWSTIKRKKGLADAKRGAAFTRLSREIVMAAREGGGDSDTNFRLRLAIEKARAGNMPKDNIDRSIKRGTGEDKNGVVYEEVTYEGYAPKGVAVLMECMTENKNRTVAEIRHGLDKYGGSLGANGSVAWQFERIAFFAFDESKMDFDSAFELAIEAGADDVTQDNGMIEIVGPVTSFKNIGDALRAANVDPEDAGLRMEPKQEMDLSVDDTLQVLRVVENLEELDDVQNIYHNMGISDEAMAALEAE
ncbi:MAG: YebC/PmpR family DNA-binding transcriptional regulator [Anaerolineales bacterium]|uniref:Probable transcriptional regulatory protein H8E29_02950 n=1 Tax=Candidatus Desulfolinea nitratireducens TaxID=2841698 RepID=A0A8J6THK8_9CHLR|nr:YebC/PmpR family DNA-binding transcriptional regulator [Candidatus Desulfolinea nitratireducens]MBL6960448.1 YebC/PmpR family DNA-binding transcriptional regulator [Anaerolineales bacterium]